MTESEESIHVADRNRAGCSPAVLLVASVLALLLVASPALAGKARVLEGRFGGAASTVANPYPLSSTETCLNNHNECQERIAVDSTLGHPSGGDVYVTDPNNRRVEKFSSKGSFILMFGKNVNKTEVEEIGSTEAERNVCTASSGDVCQQGTEGTGPGAFSDKLLAVAVDSSSDSSSGDVYVANTTTPADESKKGGGAGEGTVTKFSEDGEVISGWGVGGQMHASGQPFGMFGGITVDASGDLWVYGTVEEEEGSGSSATFRARPLIFELDETGSLLVSWQPSTRSRTTGGGIAVDGEHHVYLGVDPEKAVDKYEQGNGELLETMGLGEYLAGDLSTNMIDIVMGTATLGSGVEIVSVETSCQQLGVEGCASAETLRPSRLHHWGPLAVNPNAAGDTIYVSEQQREVAIEVVATVPNVTTLPAAPVSTSSATLQGEVNPEGVGLEQCFFEWGEGEGAYEHTAPCAAPSAKEVGAGNSLVTVNAQLGIQAGKAYHYRLVAANADDAEEPEMGADELLGPPRIDSTSAAQVTASSATLQAEINPRNLSTRYSFEYLREADYQANGESFSGSVPASVMPLAPAGLAAGQNTVAVSVHVTGLSPHTAYQYRVVAENLLGEGANTSDGPIESFETWGTGAFSLSDGRAWEMVSPPDKHGALIEPIGEDWIIQAAAGGGRLAYITRAPSESNPSGYLLYQSSIATRTSEGWASHNLAIPHTTASEISAGEGWEYRIFSEDLSHAIVQPFGPFVPCTSEHGVAQSCLSPHATEQTAFVASNYKEGTSDEPCGEGCYTPLVTGAEAVANVPPETVFGQISIFGKPCPTSLFCGPKFLEATPDLSHAVLESHVALTPSSAPKSTVPPDSLYEWSAASPPSQQLRLLSVLPGNSSHEAPPAPGPQIGFSEGSARNLISADGSRFVFTSSGHVYLRFHATEPQSPIGASGECMVAADACTVQIDGGLPGVAQFQTANSAVTRIFFTDGELKDSVVVKPDLYEYNVETSELVRMTTGGGVLASVIGASEDGSFVYFVGNGALAPHATTGSCVESTAPTASCNLYEMHYAGGHWEPPTLIAVLSAQDVTDWSSNERSYDGLAARVSPNGQWLAFMSRGRLTGYDNQDAVSNEPDAEVFEYDAATGDLQCASCSPTGARPHGVPAKQIDTGNGGIAGGHTVFLGWIAANLPPWTPSLGTSESIYQSRYLSDSGRLFFDSADALAAKDTNGTEDVYEYEPEGVPAGEHACSAGSESGGTTFKHARNLSVGDVEVQEGAGCVGLISSGESPNESGFLDASESGSEVFFITSSKLSLQDTDTGYDVYDARECTSASPCLSAPSTAPRSCEEEASCKQPPSPPPGIFGPSGSAIFSGPGNLIPALPAPTSKPKPLTKAQLLARALKTCRKSKVRKKRAACEKLARKRYGAKSASKAGKASHRGGKKR